LEVAVGDVGGLANIVDAGVGGWTTLSVSVVAVVIAVADNNRQGTVGASALNMRGLAVPPAGVVELIALSFLIRLPRPSAMPPQRRLKRLRKVVAKTR
jgi:hypothetical protein